MSFWATKDVYFIKSLLSRAEGIADLIKKKKHRNLDKMRMQSNMF